MTEQHQSGGIGSKNVQNNIQVNVSAGLTVADVKEIAQDLFRNNFEKLSHDAMKTMEERRDEIVADIIEELKKRKDVQLDTFAQPDRQVALLDAQKAFVLSGDEELKKIVVGMIADLSKEGGRELKAIVIEEAIKTVSSLTSKQIVILAIVHFLKYVGGGFISNHANLMAQFQKYILAGALKLDVNDGDLRHLEYARCGKVNTLAGPDLGSLLKSKYPGLFSLGYSEDELAQSFGKWGVPKSQIVLCVNDMTKYQVAAMDQDVIEARLKGGVIEKEQAVVLKQLLSNKLMSEHQVIAALKAVDPQFEELRVLWDTRGLRAFDLTSVGIAIAHAHIAAKDKSYPDLEIWL